MGNNNMRTVHFAFRRRPQRLERHAAWPALVDMIAGMFAGHARGQWAHPPKPHKGLVIAIVGRTELSSETRYV
eukprot:CAMPEP_0174368412 /NCGR_PEP_ID=MMETSP0811_2-20130205/88983_1 /TAXON_ID=73025 ORGANISM="Eutreptiella gymnastica-like, Strain CCMP1594" /NCGR_SAMPLE_ID=MMETSP0811_2 /ASSEMBLY_ACC=CAM_ASM_000667 /LENGTH=72 /DNA_ID=CAMNT_0015511895 /DNA_START=378 /DNA_END=592 /DNA_ORIENTATION=+